MDDDKCGECSEVECFMIPPRSWGYVRGEEREENLRALEKIVRESGSVRAQGFVHYIRSGKFYDAGDFNNGYREARRALECGEAGNDWWTRAMALNNIGVFYSQQENTITAFDYYWRAITCICQAGENDGPLLYMLYGNIGECMLAVREYHKALKYFDMVDDFDIPDDFVHAPMNTAFLNISKIECHYHLKNYFKAWRYIEEIEALEKNYEETRILRYSMLVWKYILLFMMGRERDAEPVMRKLLEFKVESISLASLKTLCTFLYEQKQWKDFKTTVSFLEEEALRQGNLALRLSAVMLWLKYHEETGDKEHYYERCSMYYQLEQKRREQEYEIRLSSFHTIVSVAERAQQQVELERVHEILRKKSEYDELTSLPNRYRLKEYCKETFRKAVEEERTISVEILDIDCFKQLNDYYGHPEGDGCLRAVGKEITKNLGEHELGARYGGDEFVIIRVGRTDEEVKEQMKALKNQVLALGIPNIHSTAADVVTISQGAVNCVPKEGQDLEELLKLADQALYCSKRESKNSYRLCGEWMEEA